jgi:hypothetical protein
MIINACFSNLFLYFEYPIDQSNIKHIIAGKYKGLPLENEVLILEANSNGKKRELETDDVDDMEINDIVPSSPPKSDRMEDIDDEFDYINIDRDDIYNAEGIVEQPLKKQKAERVKVNTSNNFYSEEQYASDISKLEERDLDFDSNNIEKNTGLSNSVILNDIFIRRQLGMQLSGGIEYIQNQAALRNNNITRGRMKLTSGR